jgi:large subunit ribosomal protein L31e
MIKEFAKQHMKNENVKIDQELNQQIWKRGKTIPPRKIRVKMSVDDNTVLVASYQDLVKEIQTEKREDK